MSRSVLGRIALPSEGATLDLAARLAEQLPEQCVVGLSGTLGAGKTRLVRAAASALGVPDTEVTSPTFTLLQSYTGRRLMHHLDAYRIADLNEFLELGVEELFDAPGHVWIEWAERVAEALPDETLWIRMSVESPQARTAEFSGLPERWSTFVDRLVTECG